MKTEESQLIIAGLINAGKAMLERFDRSKVTKSLPIRPCRRMSSAIAAAEEALTKEASHESR